MTQWDNISGSFSWDYSIYFATALSLTARRLPVIKTPGLDVNERVGRHPYFPSHFQYLICLKNHWRANIITTSTPPKIIQIISHVLMQFLFSDNFARPKVPCLDVPRVKVIACAATALQQPTLLARFNNYIKCRCKEATNRHVVLISFGSSYSAHHYSVGISRQINYREFI